MNGDEDEIDHSAAGGGRVGRVTRSSTLRDEQPGRPTGRSGSRGGKAQAYCVCRKSHENGFMIACDECDEWFHGKCVNISAAQGRRMEKYVCPFCSERRRKNSSNHNGDGDYLEEEQDEEEKDPVPQGSGEDEPLFSDDDDESEGDAYVKAPWYDPDTDHVDRRQWDAARRAVASPPPRVRTRRDNRRKDHDGHTDEQHHHHHPGHEAERANMNALDDNDNDPGFHDTSARAEDDDDAASEDQEYRPGPRKRRASSGGTGDPLSSRLEGNRMKRIRTRRADDEDDDDEEEEEEEDEDAEEEEEGQERAATRNRYRGCDDITQAMRERVVAGLAEALSMSRATEARRDAATDVAVVAQALAENIEAEMWRMFEQQATPAYKAKFRTLLFNLKDERNQELRESVLSGEMAPAELCNKTSKELAPAELAEWRKQRAEKYFHENVMITEAPGPIVKKTHKGEEVLHASPASPLGVLEQTLASPSLLSSPPLPSSSSSSSGPNSTTTSSSSAADEPPAREKRNGGSPPPSLVRPLPLRSPPPPSAAAAARAERGMGTNDDENDENDVEEPVDIDINVDISESFGGIDILAALSSSSSSSNGNGSSSSESRHKSQPHSSTHTFYNGSRSTSVSSFAAPPPPPGLLPHVVQAPTTTTIPSVPSSSSSGRATSSSLVRPSPHTLLDDVPGRGGGGGGGGSPIWRGSLIKANMENCHVVALHLAGPHTLPMQDLLPEELQVQGRVDLSKLAKYITGLSASRHRIHSLLVLEPADEASSVPYIAMLHYFGTKSRAGVVANLHGAIKEMYVVPITSDDIHFRDMLRLEEDKLLVVLVTDKDFSRKQQP